MKVMAVIWAGALAWFFAKALNVPVWRDWDMGDRTDLAVIAGGLTWAVLTYLGPRS